MGFFDFPHTRNYDSDLGFIIKRLKELETTETSALKIFRNVYEMQEDNELQGKFYAITTGFYNENDGGGACYYIRNRTTGEVLDNMFVLGLQNNLVAELIVLNNSVDIRTIGATRTNDIHDFVMATIEKNYEVFIPQGIWKTRPIQISKYNGAKIRGVSVFANNNSNGTILEPINNQSFIIKVGFENATSQCSDIRIENIMFQTGNFTCEQALFIHRTGYAYLNELCFRQCVCSDCAFKIREMYESRIGRVLFRQCDCPYALIFASRLGTGNISTDYFEYLSFEGCRGSCIKYESDCQFSSNTIDTIDFESGAVAFSDETRVSITSVSDYTRLYVIETYNGKGEITINNLNINAIAQHAYINSLGHARAYDCVIKTLNDDTGYYSFYIGVLNGVGNINKPKLIEANTIDKFFCNGYTFQGGVNFDVSINGCRMFHYLANDEFINNYDLSHLDIATRDLRVLNTTASVKGTTGRSVRVATLNVKGTKLHVKAKGNGGIYLGGSDHVTLSNVSDYKWFIMTMSANQVGGVANLLISTGASAEVCEYYFTD